MTQGRFLAMAGALMLGALGASADTVIDTIPLWDGSNRSSGWAHIAQTFTVPAVDNVLSTFELGTGSDTGGNYQVRLFDWDEGTNSAVGGALYDSGFQAATVAVTFVEFNIGVALTSGETYAIIVSWDDGGAGSGVAFSFADQYTGGYNDYTGGSIFDPWTFGPDTDFEMAFRAVFTVPGPSALALLGLAGFAGRSRRRT